MDTPDPPSRFASNDRHRTSDNSDAWLNIAGGFPAGLSGRLLGIGPDANGDGVIHCIDVRGGRGVSYRRSWVNTDSVAERLAVDPSPGPRNDGPDVVAGNIVVFGDSILALGGGSLAYELGHDLDTVRRVDLAGQSRGLSACARIDAATGDLHLITAATPGAQSHVVISAGALTRTIRTIAEAPGLVTDLATTRDRVVFVTNGFVGVTNRARDTNTTWLPTGTAAAHLVHAHDVGDAVVVTVLTPSLERWTLTPSSSPAVACEMIDPTPQHFVTNARLGESGWLVGHAHDASTDGTDIVVRNATDFTVASVATIRIAGHLPRKLRATWIPTHSRSPISRRDL